MADWSAIVNTTTAEFLKGFSDETLRDRVLFAMLRNRPSERGKYGVSNNWHGDDVQWQVKFALPEVQAHSGRALDFAATDKYRKLTHDWRGHDATDSMTEIDRLKNSGAPQLVARYREIMPDLKETLGNYFGLELYKDGVADTEAWHGLETFYATGTTVAADLCAEPNDTYGGKSTALGAIAGTWSSNLTVPLNANAATDWPEGTGDSQYDYLAPKVVNTSSTSWGTGETDFGSNCIKALRRAISWTTVTTGRAGRPDLFMAGLDWYNTLKERFETRFRTVTPHKEIEDLGFTGTSFNFEGAAITTEYGAPLSTVYGINLSKMELRIMPPQLYIVTGPTYEIRSKAWLMRVGTYANLCFRPRFFSKLSAVA